MGHQYQNAPIREALIDIQAALPPGFSLEALKSIHEKVSGDYPSIQGRSLFEGELSAGDKVSATAKQTEIGFAFSSADGKRIFQARRDGFTFSRLNPYLNWDDLRDEAKRLWDLYQRHVGALTATRVALRYINQIDIPSGSIDYKDYFLTTPEVSSSLPQGLSGFAMQLAFPIEELAGTLNLIQAAMPPPHPDWCSIVLDIEASTSAPEHLSSESTLWSTIEKLRSIKNRYFFGSITEATLRLFGDKKEY